MNVPSFFKSRQPKRFQFKPRYYDEAKERIEQKRKEARLEIERKRNSDSTLTQGSFKEAWRKNKLTSERKKSNNRVLLIAGLLAIVFYLLLR